MKGENDGFGLSQGRMYHFPHNSAFREEFDFMLRAIDPQRTGKRVYSFKEICRYLLITEVREGKFKQFHPHKPFPIFTKYPPPDLPTLIRKMGKKDAIKLAKNRISAFRKFTANPEGNYEKFVSVRYKPTKTWLQNWVEFVRDYADLAAYCGLLPAFFKNPFGDSPEDGYVVSDLMDDYLRDKTDFSKVLMGMKYSNSSINLERYRKFFIRVRPFYSTLRILASLKREGVKAVDFRLLAALVACLRSEEEIDAAVQFVKGKYVSGDLAVFERISDRRFLREAARFSLSLLSFLEADGLIVSTRIRGTRYVRVSAEGENLLNKTPGRSIFYGWPLEEYKLTPLLGHLLSVFRNNAEKETWTIRKDTLERDLRSFVKPDEVEAAIDALASLKSSPISKVSNLTITLASLNSQYSVNAATDFASLNESRFVESGVGALKEIAKLKPLVAPPQTVLSQLRARALASNGNLYEDSIYDSLRRLGIGKVKQYGHAYAGQRLSDVVWEVPILDSDSNSEKQIMVVVEAKAGNAVKQLDERAMIDDFRRTLALHRSKFPSIAGIWFWLLDSQSLPIADGHGGARPGTKTFLEKLQDVVMTKMSVNKLIIVMAMNIESFTAYYSYLYGLLKGLKPPLSDTSTPQFWIWGNMFRPISSYVFIYNDKREVERQLFAPV